MSLSALIFAEHGPENLETVLQSLSWADEVIILAKPQDDLDSRLKQISSRQARIRTIAEWPLRLDSEIFSLPRHDWLLVLTDDETLSADAPAILQTWLAESAGSYSGLALPRFNYIGGRLLTGPNWYPDHQFCLFNRTLIDRRQELFAGRPAIAADTAMFQPPDCPHLHRCLGADLLQYVQRRLNRIAAATAAMDPESYDWSTYLAQAQTSLAQVLESNPDGDMGQALALISVWEQLLTGLLRWDSLDPQPPLKLLPAFPVVVDRLSRKEIMLRRMLLKRQPIRFRARLAWRWLQSRWWRMRGYT